MKHRMLGMNGLLAACGLAAIAVMTPRISKAQEAIPAPPPPPARASAEEKTCTSGCGATCTKAAESACASAYGATCTQAAAMAEHPVGCPMALAADGLHRVIINDKGQVTVFVTKLPALGQVLNEACRGPSSCEELLARLGREMNVQATASCGEQTCDTSGHVVRARFIRLGCPVAATAGECACGGKCPCSGGETTTVSHTTECKCCTCRDASEVSHSSNAGHCSEAGHSSEAGHCQGEAKCGGEGCHLVAAEVTHDEESLPPHHPLKLIQHIASLMADKAAAEAALETQQASHAEQSELFETVAELMAANAALQTKLEAQCEQARLAEKLADLAAENARLKAHVELAAERTELTRGAISLSIENERLKLRLAEMEHRHAAEEAVRTAERSRGNRKSR